MIEEIRRQNDNLRKLQETRLLIREINPRGDGAINGCANDAIMALRDGRVALDKVLELKRSLGALVTNADPDNEGIEGALREASRMVIFFDGVKIGAREAARLLAEKIERTV